MDPFCNSLDNPDLTWMFILMTLINQIFNYAKKGLPELKALFRISE
jgi:hypothetical protein